MAALAPGGRCIEARSFGFDWSSRRPPVQHLPHDLYPFSIFHSEDIDRQSMRLKPPCPKPRALSTITPMWGQRLRESPRRLVRDPAVCSDKIVSHASWRQMLIAVRGGKAPDILGGVQHVGARVPHRGAYLPCEYGELPQVLAHPSSRSPLVRWRAAGPPS